MTRNNNKKKSNSVLLPIDEHMRVRQASVILTFQYESTYVQVNKERAEGQFMMVPSSQGERDSKHSAFNIFPTESTEGVGTCHHNAFEFVGT